MATTVREICEMISDKGGGSRMGRFRTLRTNQKTAQNWYNMKYEVKIHDEFKKIKLPTARQMVDTFVSHLPLSNPTVKVIPFKEKNPYIKRAELQQRYYDALIRWNIQQTTNYLRDAAKDMGTKGEAFIKVVWDENALGAAVDEKDEEKRQQAMLERMPLKILAREPSNCYPSPDHVDCQPVDMIEQYTIMSGQIQRIWPKWRPGSSSNIPTVFTEYWDREALCFLADGVPVTDGVEENTYGCVPYCHVYSGYGHRDADNSPESLAVGIFQHSLDLLMQQCRDFSYLDKAEAFASLPMLLLPGNKEDYEQGGKSLVPKPGQVTYTGDFQGEVAKVVWAANNLPAGIMQAIAVHDAMLSKSQPQVLRGEAPKGLESGYPLAMMIGEARLEFGIPLENLQTLFSRSCNLVRTIIRDVVKEEVPIWGTNGVITLNPSDCEGAYRVSVEFDATTPEAAANRALILQRLRQGGDISRQTALELNPMIKNPAKESIRIDAESLSKHPAIQRMIALKAAKAKYGQEEAMAIEQAMTEGEEGAERKAKSSGIPQGGTPEGQIPEDVLAQAIGKRQQAKQGRAGE